MTDPALAQLIADRDIRRLIAAYCDAVGRRDADAAGALFADDVRVVIAGAPEILGRAAMEAGMRESFAAFSFLHQRCDNGLIDVADDGLSAKARWSVFESAHRPGKDVFNLIFGTYEDEYKLLPEGWRFQNRCYTLDSRVSLPFSRIQEFAPLVPKHVFAI